jgi:hypothetical protein
MNNKYIAWAGGIGIAVGVVLVLVFANPSASQSPLMVDAAPVATSVDASTEAAVSDAGVVWDDAPVVVVDAAAPVPADR